MSSCGVYYCMERVAHILPGASDRWGVSARGALLAAAPAQDNQATGPLSPAGLDVIPGHGRNILIRLSPSVVNHHRRESLLLLTSSLVRTAAEFLSCQIKLPFFQLRCRNRKLATFLHRLQNRELSQVRGVYSQKRSLANVI